MTLSTPTTDRPARPLPRRKRRGGPVLATVTVVMLGVGAIAAWGWWRGSLGSVPIRPHCTATALDSTAELDPDQAANAATIAAVAVRRGLPGRAATIAIATAMQESKLINVPGGDRDSVGLFQQRPSQGWGTADQVHDPVYAANAFYDVLVKIEGYQDLPITQAAQKVQRSAFPTAYAEHEPQARIWASTLTGYSPGGLSCVLRSAPRGSEGQAAGTDGLSPRARALANAASAATGRSGTPLAGSDGTAVRFAITGSENSRSGWALAHWAVASAADLDVVAVETEGRQWRRSASTAGWTALAGGPPAGTVVVRLAS